MSDGAWGFAGVLVTALGAPALFAFYKLVVRLGRIEAGTAYSASQAETAANQTKATGNGFASRVTASLEKLEQGQERAMVQREAHGELLANLTGRFEQHIADAENQAREWGAWRRSIDQSD